MRRFVEFLDTVRHRVRSKCLDSTRVTGKLGEDLAHRYLQGKGYVIVGRNYRTRSGSAEVDLIGWDSDVLAFIEVKTRRTDSVSSPDRAVDPAKQEHIIRAARAYLTSRELSHIAHRFDVVSVVLSDTPSLQLQKQAFHSSPRKPHTR